MLHLLAPASIPNPSFQPFHHPHHPNCSPLPPCSRVLMCHLRSDEDVEKELTGKLRDDELKALLASTHRPNYIMQASLRCADCCV